MPIERYVHIPYNIIKIKEQNSEESKINTGLHRRVGQARLIVNPIPSTATDSGMKGEYSVGSRALENRINKIKALEEQRKALDDQIEALKNEIKADMISKGAEELQAGNFVVRMKEVVTSRFDSKKFKENYKTLYEAYSKPQSAMRFTIV